ncbi:hypothetical protein A2841_02925 [Candidatus Kaiserbacteria bacterium RIFCSPHIGHO2_01_FULL_48_10]|uniref:MurNAc-LAA domain-containing protein n=1 Tax=Candidatus Kaiserbacteria bacterium RIFCSPHIGHO2_01_FULL_48_10 TaxID=1798476 RepID=A0A1F6C5W9_9BACT|nr:MAG: hypothetical protein A2841_02925 [Candidatus Kaiserbacteria bacterium RIFCSPHIGHO2_01_FULL_48_10]
MFDFPEKDVFAASIAIAIIFFLAGGAHVMERTLGGFSVRLQEAAVFLASTMTVTELRTTYEDAPDGTVVSALVSAFRSSERPVRILIVPGHEPEFGGTEFKSALERDIVVDIADKLSAFLSENPRYTVTVSRTKSAWNPIFETYFSSHWEDIKLFRQTLKDQTRLEMENGSILPAADQVRHNKTDEDVALRLYGINKWASENDIDITLHLHMNDYPGHKRQAGKYSGFTIYIQDHQFSNAEVSRAVGEAIAHRLNAYHATSTLPVESAGVVEDQKLIAVGSNDSVSNASVLIEYAYIYEPQFLDPKTRAIAEADYAYQTYLALQDFFGDPISGTYGSGVVPYEWDSPMEKGEPSAGVYALQSALHYLDFYPPKGEEFSDCPISGNFGPCTERALKAFQKAYDIDTTGTFGPKTKRALESALVQ